MSVALAFEEHGEGPAVVLLGSLGTSRTMWAPQVAALRAQRRVVAVDHRGHGGSPVPRGPYSITDLGLDVLALLDRLELPDADVCGTSLGGMIGMWLAGTHPDRVRRLVLFCTAAHLAPASAWTERAAAVRAGGTGVVAEAVAARWFTGRFRATAPADVSEAVAGLAATPAEGYASCCEAIATMDLRPLLGSIQAPTLVVAGADDPATTVSDAAVIAAAIPGARLEVVAGAAHLLTREHPDVANRLMLEHLDA